MDSIWIPAAGGALELEQIWAGGRSIEMPLGHPVSVQQAAGAQKRGCLPGPVPLGLHWGNAAPEGGHGERCQEEVSGTQELPHHPPLGCGLLWAGTHLLF